MTATLIDHPDRYVLAAEVHARLSVELHPPVRASYLAALIAPTDRGAELAHLTKLCARFNVTPPPEGATHFSAKFDTLQIKWERHGEFSGYSFFVQGLNAVPFSETAASFLPDNWLDGIPGQRIVAAHARLMPRGEGLPSADEVSEFFLGNIAVGAEIGEGAGVAYTDFKIHKDGYSRFVVVDRSMSPDQAGRMLQRLFEIEAYRMLALLALPIARKQSPKVSEVEQSLVTVTNSIAAGTGGDEALLAELSMRSAEVERAIAESQFRYGASRAYAELVRTRIEELREKRMPGVQTIDEFMTRRLAPAIATCVTVSQRLHDLSERISRTSGLLSTRVDIAREKQNQTLLASMDRRAKLQLRLQQTVEGLSIAAITYYVVGLAGWVFKAVHAAGVNVNIDLATGLSIPVVVLFVALLVRRARRKIIGSGDSNPRSGDD
jgi:uncharacterized membrane-anchored protein